MLWEVVQPFHLALRVQVRWLLWLPVAVDHQHVSAAVLVVPRAKTQRLQELSIPFSS